MEPFEIALTNSEGENVNTLSRNEVNLVGCSTTKPIIKAAQKVEK